jgi:hypothetical protein
MAHIQGTKLLNPTTNSKTAHITNQHKIHVRFGDLIEGLGGYYQGENVHYLVELLIRCLDLALITTPSQTTLTTPSTDSQTIISRRQQWMRMTESQQRGYRDLVSYLFHLFFHVDNLPISIAHSPQTPRAFYNKLFSVPAFGIVIESILLTRNVSVFVQFIMSGYQPTPQDFSSLFNSSQWYPQNLYQDYQLAEMMHSTFYGLQVINHEALLTEEQQRIKNEPHLPQPQPQTINNPTPKQSQIDQSESLTISTPPANPTSNPNPTTIEIPNNPKLIETIDFFHHRPPLLSNFQPHFSIATGFEPIINPIWLKTVSTLKSNKISSDHLQYLTEVWNLKPGKGIFDQEFGTDTQKNDPSDQTQDEQIDQNGQDSRNDPFATSSTPSSTPLVPISSPKHRISKSYIKKILALMKQYGKGNVGNNEQNCQNRVDTIFNTFDPITTTTTGLNLRFLSNHLIENLHDDTSDQDQVDGAGRLGKGKRYPLLPSNQWFVYQPSHIQPAFSTTPPTSSTPTPAESSTDQISSQHLIEIDISHGGDGVVKGDGENDNEGSEETKQQSQLSPPTPSFPIDPHDEQYLMNRAYLHALEQVHLAEKQKKIGPNGPNYSHQSTILDLFFIMTHAIGPRLPTLFLHDYFKALPYSCCNYLGYLLWMYLYPQNTITHQIFHIPLLSTSGPSLDSNITPNSLWHQKMIIKDVVGRLYSGGLATNHTSSPSTPSQDKSKTALISLEPQPSFLLSRRIYSGFDPTPSLQTQTLSPTIKTPSPPTKPTLTTTILYLEQLKSTISYLILACYDVLATNTYDATLPQRLYPNPPIHPDPTSPQIATTSRPYFSSTRALISGTNGRWLGKRAMGNGVLLGSISLLLDIITTTKSQIAVITSELSTVGSIWGLDGKDESGDLEELLSGLGNINVAFSTLIDITLRTIHSSPTVIPNLLHLLISHGYPLPADIYPGFNSGSAQECVIGNDDKIDKNNRTSSSPYWWVQSAPTNIYHFVQQSFNPMVHYYVAVIIQAHTTTPPPQPSQQPSFHLPLPFIPSIKEALMTRLQLNNTYLSTILKHNHNDSYVQKERFCLFLPTLLSPPPTTSPNDSPINKLLKSGVNFLGQNQWHILMGTRQPRLLTLILTILSATTTTAFNLSGLLSTDFLERTILHHFISKPTLHDGCCEGCGGGVVVWA